MKDIKTSKKLHYYDLNIIDMAYSHSEGRIGTVNTDYTISFWDTQDNFTFEKVILNPKTDLHIQIYYIHYCNYWITVDEKFYIHIWDITEDTEETLPKKNNMNILDI